MRIVIWLYIFGGFIFLFSIAGFIFVQIRLRPGSPSDLDNYYHEFEDAHPDMIRYNRWYRITMSGAAIGAAMIFGALAI